jgi:hypothetical protein
MTDMPANADDFNPSAPMMSAKAVLLELYHDMKIVRPIAEELQRADVVARLAAIETDHAIRDAQGGQPRSLVSRVEALEDINQDELAAGRAYKRVAHITNRTLAIVVVVANTILGLVVGAATLHLGPFQ